MATALISCSNGNFSSAASWGLVNNESVLNYEIASQVVTTSWQGSSFSLTVGITVDGVAVKLASVAASPTGTFSIRLYNGSAIPGTTVIVNVSDLPPCTTALGDNSGGWVFFKFASPVSLTSRPGYCVQVQTSVSNQVYLYNDGTSYNWSRCLRTTTNQAPTGGANPAETIIVAGELTGQGAGNNITITMDVNDTVNYYGNKSTILESICICKRGTLSWNTAGNTQLMIYGNLVVYTGGICNIGTTGSPIPDGTTAIIKFNSQVDGDYGLQMRGGNTSIQGNIGTRLVAETLGSDVTAGDNHFHTENSTGWANGDVVVVASTTRTASQAEKKTVDSSAGTTVNISSTFTNARSGTSPTQAEVIMLTRNVKITRAGTKSWYAWAGNTATLDMDYAEMSYTGSDSSLKRGFQLLSKTGSQDVKYCSFYDGGSYGLVAYESSSSGPHANIIISHNVFNHSSPMSSNYDVYLYYNSYSNVTVSDNISIRAYNGIVVSNSQGSITITGNKCANSSNVGFYLTNNNGLNMTISDNDAHSCNSYGYNVVGYNHVISGGKIWRCNTWGIYLAAANSTFENMNLWGNTTANITTNGAINLLLHNIISNSETSYTTSYGLLLANNYRDRLIILESCDFSTPSGNLIAHTFDVKINQPAWTECAVDVKAANCKFGGASVYGDVNGFDPNYYTWLASQKHDQVSGDNRLYTKYGICQTDSAAGHYKTAAPSWKMTPSNATYKLQSSTPDAYMKAAVNSGEACSPSVWIRKSSAAAGDSADYNGNQPRLFVKNNPSAGIAVDVVLDTMSVSVGEWEQLSGATDAVDEDSVLEFYVDCDGTTGFINVDDWSVG